MKRIRLAKDRGHFNFGWLDTYHSFSFAEYHDPEFMGFKTLRVLNDDRVAPERGFSTHSHRDMEIISYITEGVLAHKDSMGNGSDIHVGEIQYMSAGSGVTHSEFNHGKDSFVHLIQIWILPDEKSATPRYGQQKISIHNRPNQFELFCSKEGRQGSIGIRQTTDLWGAVLEKDKKISHALNLGGYGYLHIVKGEVAAGESMLGSGDALILSQEKTIEIVGRAPKSEVLFFDLP